MNICFFSQWLGAGGAERTIATLSHEFAENGHNVYIVLLGNKIEYDLDKRVNVYIIDNFIGHESPLTILKKRKARNKKLKEIVNSKKIDVLVCLLAPNIIYTKGVKIPIISSERSNPLKERGLLKRIVTNYLFRKVDGIVFQTSGVVSTFPKIIQKKGTVIGNPIGYFYKGAPLFYNYRIDRVATAGRLFELKDYPTLLKAFQIVLKTHQHCVLDIFGDGPKKEEYIRLAHELGIQDNVVFHGVQKSYLDKIANYKCFVFSSKCEGMPNALLEAFASGIPCVSTDCDFGPREIINNGFNGILVKVGDYEQLAKGIIRMLDDEAFSNQCSKESKIVFQKYSLEIIVAKYLDYIEKVISKKENNR